MTLTTLKINRYIDHSVGSLYDSMQKRPIRILEIGSSMYGFLNERYEIQYQSIEQDVNAFHRVFGKYYDRFNFRIVKGDPTDQNCYKHLPWQDVIIWLGINEFNASKIIENINIVQPELVIASVCTESDWRYVLREFKKNFNSVKTRFAPFRFLPGCFASSIIIKCK